MGIFRLDHNLDMVESGNLPFSSLSITSVIILLRLCHLSLQCYNKIAVKDPIKQFLHKLFASLQTASSSLLCPVAKLKKNSDFFNGKYNSRTLASL